MSDELSPQARRIVDAARDADQPSDRDRRRLRGAVMAAIAAAAVPAATKTAAAASAAPAATASAATVPLAVKAMAVAAALAAVGVGAYLVGRDDPSVPPPTRQPSLGVDSDDTDRDPTEAPREPRRAVEPEPELEQEPEMEFAPDHVGPGERRQPSTISAERELLTRVRAAHTAGSSSEALALLDDYTRQFAGGKLLEERSALRVLVLCDLGRTSQARREAASFLRRWPHSVQAERVEGSCAGDPNE